jgi:hypothetical protein
MNSNNKKPHLAPWNIVNVVEIQTPLVASIFGYFFSKYTCCIQFIHLYHFLKHHWNHITVIFMRGRGKEREGEGKGEGEKEKVSLC